MNFKETQNNMNDKINNGNINTGNTVQDDDNDGTVYMNNGTVQPQSFVSQEDTDSTVYISPENANGASQFSAPAQDDDEGTAYMQPQMPLNRQK